MKHVTLRQIKIFESVARNLSFSRAAEDLHLTQPAVSMQIKQMEGLAGLPLFEHTGKRLFLTEGGSVVLHHCQMILANLHAAEESLVNLMRGGVQRLRVGVITSGSRVFPHLINAFLQRGDAIELDMKIMPRNRLIDLLRDEQIDLAVMVRAPQMPRAVAQPFAGHDFVLVAAPGHALAGARGLPIARIAAECVFVREAGSDTRLVADEIFLGRAAARFMELNCSEAIKQSVLAGLGVGLLSMHEVASEVRDGRLSLLDVHGFPLRRHWHVVHRDDSPLPPVARDFRQFLLTHGDNGMAVLADA